MVKDDVSKLTLLGQSAGTDYVFTEPLASMLETFTNQQPDRDYMIQLEFPEYTSRCPKTGQPDFAVILLEYIPDKKCVETKSLKLYFFAYRDHGCFMETITNKILNDLVEAVQPRYAKVIANFNPRGGIRLQCVAEHVGESFKDKRA